MGSYWDDADNDIYLTANVTVGEDSFELEATSVDDMAEQVSELLEIAPDDLDITIDVNKA